MLSVRLTMDCTPGDFTQAMAVIQNEWLYTDITHGCWADAYLRNPRVLPIANFRSGEHHEESLLYCILAGHVDVSSSIPE